MSNLKDDTCYTLHMFSKIKPALIILLPVALVLTLSYFLQGFILANQEEFAGWLSQFGPYVILVYILLQVITIILAPLGGTALVIGMIALFGPGFALTLAYLVVTPAYLINFWLARRFGRPLVERFLGKMVMKKVDHYVADAGTFTLVILRLFLGGYFDYLSYGIGLTKVPFKTFVIINFLAGIPSSVLYYIIFTKTNSLTFGILAFYGLTAFFTGFVIIYNHYMIKHRSLQKEN